MKHSKWILSLLATFTLIPFANAGVLSLGTVSDTTYLLGVDLAGKFTDTYSFNLSGPSNLTDTFGNYLANINGFSFELVSASSPSTAIGSSTGQGSYSNLSSGAYDFIFSGTVPHGFFGIGAYFGDFHVASAGAVPELDTWLMLVVGAGLLVYQLRRRQSSLRHAELTPS